MLYQPPSQAPLFGRFVVGGDQVLGAVDEEDVLFHAGPVAVAAAQLDGVGTRGDHPQSMPLCELRHSVWHFSLYIVLSLFKMAQSQNLQDSGLWSQEERLIKDRASNCPLTKESKSGILRVAFVDGVVAQSVRASACHAEGREFESLQPRHSPRGSSSGVEHNLAKVGVAGSNPVFRSIKNESPAVCTAGFFRIFRRERPFVP